MSTDQLLRPEYFEGQYLGAEDLAAIVEYARVGAARHTLGAHTWGIAIGLALKEVPMAGGQIVVFIQPGLAWDGFGRPVVLLSPAPVSGDLFKDFVYDPIADEPNGRQVAVWLRYRETETRAPADGFEVCNDAANFSRIFETYALEAADPTQPPARANIIVNGASVPAEQALQSLDPADPLIPDASIPFQSFPDTGPVPRWPIALGIVRWKPNPVAGQPGQFMPTLQADKDRTRTLRTLIGAVAGAVQAPEGTLRLKDRIAPPSPVSSEELVWVEGKLRVDSDARLFGGKLEFRDAQGQDQAAPLLIQRTGDNQAGGRNLRVRIGSAQAGLNHLEVGPEVSNVFQPRLTVRDDGRVGIGTSDPGALLEIRDGDLLLKSSGEDAGDLIFQNSAGAQKGRVWSKPTPGMGLFLSSGDNTPDITIDENGQVGIGTTTPNRALTIDGPAGTYLNIHSDGGAHEVLLGADGNGGIVSSMSNDDLVLRSGGNLTRVWIKAAGNVGINNSNPAVQLHVTGDRLRLQNGGKQVDLRTDGSAVDLQSETNHLYLRSSGPGGNNNIIMNPFPEDGNVAIGNQAPVAKLHVSGDQNGDASQLSAHVAVIENVNTGDSADVLALRVGRATVSGGNNFITFFAGNSPAGRIEGAGGTSVTYATSGADFAECLPRLDRGEVLEGGDVVGIVNGYVTRRTKGAAHISAITERPALLGNAPAEEEARFARVAMLGQVPVKVRGAVASGDLLFPSGLDDGAAIALSAEQAAREGRTDVIGTAWQASSDAGLKTVRTAVGFASPLLRLQQAALQRLLKPS